MKQTIGSHLLAVLLALPLATAQAGPAEPGIWRTLKTPAGGTVRAELQGDEHLSYYRDAAGALWLPQRAGVVAPVEAADLTLRMQEAHRQHEQLMPSLQAPTTPAAAGHALRQPRRAAYSGVRKGLILMVQFADVRFDAAHGNDFYQRFANERGFDYAEQAGTASYQFRGSVKDYFLDQSMGQFEMDFDVVGPFTVSHERDYYGQQVTYGLLTTYTRHDAHLGYMVYEALQQAYAAGTDFSAYDWDGDGAVEQVFVIFAGQGQADGGGDNCIWPCRSSLTNQISYERTLALNVLTTNPSFSMASYSVPRFNGYKVDVFACANELKTLNASTGLTCVNGLGTTCHEFSHCLGLKDHYDTNGTTGGSAYGTGYWDVMSVGLYNGTTFVPAGYSAYERWQCGWIEPEVLDEPRRVDVLQPLNTSGQSYLVYCNTAKTEYYLLENRQPTGWDALLPHKGVLITHVNYNATRWNNNLVNATAGQEGVALFNAGGVASTLAGFNDAYPWDPDELLRRYKGIYGNTTAEILAYFKNRTSNPLTFGSAYNDELTSASSPKATRYNGSTSQSTFTGHEITQMQRHADGTASFLYRPSSAQTTLTLDETVTTPQTYAAGLYREVSLQRSLTANEWSTLWLPFSLTADEVAAYFGPSATVAHLSLTGETDADGQPLLAFSTERQSITAHEPFLVRLEGSEGDRLTVGPFALVQVEDSSQPAEQQAGTFTLVGTRQAQTLDEGDFFISQNTFYRSMGKSRIKALRAYLTAHADVEDAKIALRIDGEQVTAIEGLTTAPATVTSAGVFDLSGRRLTGPLRPGLYIVGGRKMVVGPGQ